MVEPQDAPDEVERRIDGFVAEFDPGAAALVRACRAGVRELLPTAVELVYDNYNFLVFAFCATPGASTSIVSIAAAANGVMLSFFRGATLTDPTALLLGAGKQTRYVRLPSAETLRDPAVVALVAEAAASGPMPMPTEGPGPTRVASVSPTRRPRRRTP